MKKLAAYAALAAFAVATPALAADDLAQKIRDAGVVKVCHAESLPWAVKDAATGEWKGTDIEASKALENHGASTKFDTSWGFFQELRDAGREAAAAFLRKHYKDVGVRATLDLRAEFM